MLNEKNMNLERYIRVGKYGIPVGKTVFKSKSTMDKFGILLIEQ